MIEFLTVYGEMSGGGQAGFVFIWGIPFFCVTVCIGMWWDRGVRLRLGKRRDGKETKE